MCAIGGHLQTRADQLAQLGARRRLIAQNSLHTDCGVTPICPVQTPTTQPSPRETWPSRVTVRVSPTTHGLLHTMAAAEGYRSAADLVRHYLAKGLQVDGIDPLEIGLLPPTP